MSVYAVAVCGVGAIGVPVLAAGKPIPCTTADAQLGSLQTVSAELAAPGTISGLPDIAPGDAAVISGAVLGLWALAWAVRMVGRMM